MERPTATIIRKIPIYDHDMNDREYVREWDCEETTARVGIVKPGATTDGDLREGGGVELVREDNGDNIFIPFDRESDWIILASIPDPEIEDPESAPIRFNPFTAGGILALKQLADQPASGQEAGLWYETIGEWRDCIRELHANDPDLVLPEHLSTILTETYLDTVPPAELPRGITAGGLARMVMANSLRLDIAELREEDRMKPTLEWIGELREEWQVIPGRGFLDPFSSNAYPDTNPELGLTDDQIREIANATDTLVSEIFVKLTTRSPEGITAGWSREKPVKLIERLQSNGALEISAPGNSDWGESVQKHIRGVLDRYFQGLYQPECRLFVTANDQDVLVVADHQLSYFYSWPSATRAPVVDTLDGKPVITAIAEQIPTPEEIIRLNLERENLLIARLGDEEPEPKEDPTPREDSQSAQPGMM